MRYFVPFVICLVWAMVAFAAPVILRGNFVETQDSLPGSRLPGQFYYYYHDTNASLSRLRFTYSVPYGTTRKAVSNLYHYGYNAMYSMCGKCTAETIKERPDPWWKSDIYVADGTTGYLKRSTIDPKVNQVSRIKLASDTIPEKIEFVDGRKLTLTNVERNPSDLTANSGVFSTDPGASCPTPTCSMLADIVFVMDYSGSVSRSEWTEMANFVISVMNSFTFGDYAAAAACVQFCAPYCQDRPDSEVWTTIPGCYYWHVKDDILFDVCGGSSLTPDMTAKVLAARELPNGNYTVSTYRDDLINVMQKSRQPYGRTCQAYGLELAAQLLENSPRNSYPVKPHRIVIGMTDGDDYCPNRTRRAAKMLIDEYDVLYIGIGIALDCDYDKNYIKSIVSKLGSDPAYFDVKDFSAIKNIVDQLFTPLCEEFHQAGCGQECKGFCGCGDCFCPDCDATGNTCSDLQCTARDGTASGCVNTTNKTACPASDKCTQYTCEYHSNTHSNTCPYTWACSDVQKKNPGTCRTTKCKADGTCQVVRDDSVCKKAHTNDMCEEWTCAEEGKSKNDYPSGEYDETTGCYRSKNMHKTCADKGKDKCVDYTCSMKTGKCEPKDLCVSDKCTTRECPMGSNGEYGKDCKDTPVTNPSTMCTFYECDPIKGWEEVKSKGPEECKEEFAGSTDCKDFTCDDKLGCQWTAFEDPNQCLLCTPQFKADCTETAQKKSTVKSCRLGICKLDKDAQPYCNVNDANDHENITDCTTSEVAASTRSKNANNPSTCFTVECMAGLCKEVPVPRKPNEIDDNCTKYVCDEYTTGQWRWKSVPTSTATQCVTDDCTHRVCVPDTGCVETDICRNRTTECVSYSCKEDETTGNPVCKGVSMLQSYECMYERCNDGKKEKVYNGSDIIRQYCPNDDVCTDVSCSVDGECVFRSKIDIEKEKDGEDPCKLWDCDGDGVVTWRWKCDDGLFCTDDKCSFDGSTCRNSPINCYLEVNMTDYPCFRAECVEGDDNYRCVRKLKSGVYIDICGNCLRDYIPTSSESEESLAEADEDCIEAPEDPMIKEGLAAASIALIVLGAIIIGGAMAASGVIGTKTLLERARAANNQSAHTNPLFEDNEAEMTNPAFAGDR